MDRIPILRMGDILLVTIQVDMHDRLAMTLQDDLTSRIVTARASSPLTLVCVLTVLSWAAAVTPSANATRDPAISAFMHPPELTNVVDWESAGLVPPK